MRELGGGGHGGAGSAQIRGLEAEAVERRIADYLQGHGPMSVRVADMMSFPVHTVRPDMPMSGAAVMLRERGCTGVPVVDGEGRLVGVLSRRDFRKLRRESQLDAPVKEKATTWDRSPTSYPHWTWRELRITGCQGLTETGQLVTYRTRVIPAFIDELPVDAGVRCGGSLAGLLLATARATTEAMDKPATAVALDAHAPALAPIELRRTHQTER